MNTRLYGTQQMVNTVVADLACTLRVPRNQLHVVCQCPAPIISRQSVPLVNPHRPPATAIPEPLPTTALMQTTGTMVVPPPTLNRVHHPITYHNPVPPWDEMGLVKPTTSVLGPWCVASLALAIANGCPPSACPCFLLFHHAPDHPP